MDIFNLPLPVRIGIGMLAGTIVIAALANQPDRPTANADEIDWNAGYRALQIKQCIGIVDRNKSLTEYASELTDRAARTGVDVETLQVMDFALAEQRNPGVGKRCAARVDG